MKVAIVGEPRSGKSALLSLLLAGGGARRGKQEYDAVVSVPDPRLDWLSALYRPKKTTPATLEFSDAGADLRHVGLDLAGLLALGDVRNCEALALVLDGHSAPLDPEGVESFELATAVADLDLVERRLEKLVADRKRGLKEAEREMPLLERLRDHLSDERPLRSMELGEDERRALRGYQFLSLKPALVVANVAEEQLAEGIPPALAECCARAHHELCLLSAPIEAELAEMDEGDRAEFMAELGITEPARDRFLRTAYASLGLISFLTVGPDECRAWTVERGSTAPEAAGKIHTDLQRGFIRAEVVAFDDLQRHGEMKDAKSAGVVRLEGKDYVVADGDVIEIRFSV